jgi:hypothetical protein
MEANKMEEGMTLFRWIKVISIYLAAIAVLGALIFYPYL